MKRNVQADLQLAAIIRTNTDREFNYRSQGGIQVVLSLNIGSVYIGFICCNVSYEFTTFRFMLS